LNNLLAQLDSLPPERPVAARLFPAPGGAIPQSLARTLEWWAAETPNAPAVVCGARTWTYHQLNERANQAAAELRRLGVTRGDVVGVSLERSDDWIIVILAIVKCRAAYLPLDATLPLARLQSMLADSRARFVLARPADWSRLQATVVANDSALVDVERCLQNRAAEDTANAAGGHPAPNSSAAADSALNDHRDDLAYVMFTSGSTGQPKGVMVQQGAILQLVFDNDFVTFGRDRVFVHLASISFDAATWEIWGALLHGAQLVVATSQQLEFQALETLLKTHRVTTTFLTAAFFNDIIDVYPQALTNLQEIMVGGEALSVARIVQGYERLPPPVQLINGYGPTECTVFSLTYRIPRTIAREWPSVPIGKPLAHTTAYVLDQQLREVPSGVSGELYIGGAGLALGYINQPELTAERFIVDPFSTAPHARLYRTGDGVRRLADGNLEFIERLDRQVKLRGFRIELGEIEAMMGRHPEVRQSAVLLREDRPGDKRLVGYYSPVSAIDDNDSNNNDNNNAALSAPSSHLHRLTSNIMDWLRAMLPQYMLPACLIAVPDWPVNANGKLDRHRLPAPADDTYRWQREYVAPRTSAEERLARHFADLLGLQQVGIHDRFFELGGHSLLATRLQHRLVCEFGWQLPLSTIFTHPTVAELAEELERSRSGPDQQEPPTWLRPIAARIPSNIDAANDRIPLSYHQQRLWFLDQFEGSLSAYNLAFAWRLTGPLNQTALQRAFELLVQRHAALRTNIHSHDGAPYQVVQERLATGLVCEELTSTSDPPGVRSTEASDDLPQQILEKELDRPFQIGCEPLIRGRLVKLGDADQLLVMTCHHLVTDGWSMPILWHDLRLAYEACCLDREPTWEPRLIDYPDFACWQREQLTSVRLQPLIDYWQQQLQGLTQLDLPTDFARPERQSYAGQCHRFTIDAIRLARLQRLAQQQQVTLNMLLLSIFQTLLHRYSGETDLAIAMPVAGRDHEQLEHLVGFFVNTLVIRGNLSGDPTFQELLQRTRKTVLEALDHQHLPFEKLVEELRPERVPNRNPLAQVSFQFLQYDFTHLTLPALTTRPILARRVPARFDLEMNLWQRDQQIEGGIVYRTDLFRSRRMERLAGHFLTLIDAVLDQLDQPISRLPLLTTAERNQILIDWNATTRPYPAEQTLSELVEQQAAQTPDAMALVDGDREWTYQQFNAQANHVAWALRRQGVARGDIVGIAMERSAEWVIAILGVLKCGAAYLPLDPAHPARRLDFMLDDTQARFVLGPSKSLARLEPLLQSHQIVGINWNDCSPATEQYGTDARLMTSFEDDDAPSQNPPAIAQPEDLAYVMFTSGSTGRPKGVAIRHRSVCRLVFANDYITVGRDRVFAHLSSISFDASVWEIWNALLHGSKLVIGHSEQLDFNALEQLLRQQNVTTIFLTSTLLNEVIDHHPTALASVSEVMTGGEALSVPHIVSAYQQLGDRLQIVNAYGPTESTVCTTALRIPREINLHWSSVPIGKPLANTTVYILDAQRQLVPIGVRGELYIGGPGLAAGYVAQPEHTAERFVPHPFSDDPQERLYRTGDCVRWMEDGNIEFLGRSDEQVKLRGQRIELGEIELAIRGDARIHQAVVVVREDRPGDKQLVAYYSTLHDEPVDLHDRLCSILPSFMVPHYFIAMRDWPLTSSGKLDRKRLPAPIINPAVDSSVVVPPASDLEAELVTLFARLLGQSQLSTTANFFESGGHSLLAVRLQNCIRTTIFSELSLRDVFDFPSVQQLARRIQEVRQQQSASVAETAIDLLPSPATPHTTSWLTISRRGTADHAAGQRAPLSYSQQRLWFLDQYESGLAAYNIAFAWRLYGPFDVSAWQQAVTLVEQRHPALRTNLQSHEGQPYQIVEPTPRIQCELEILSSSGERAQSRSLPKAARESGKATPAAENENLASWLATEFERPFDLGHDSLMRLRLVNIGDQDHLLIMAWHHVATDGWSFPILWRDLQRAYGACRRGERPAWDSLSVDYVDYAIWQSKQLTDERLQPLIAYWRQQLAGLTPLELPADFVRPERPSHAGRCFRFSLDSTRVNRLNQLAQQQQVTMNMLLLSIFQTLLYRYTGQTDVAIAMPVAGREQEQLDQLVGFFVNTLVIRSDLSGQPTMPELLQRTRKTVLDALDHQLLPFEKLVEELRPERIRHRNPLTDISFQFIGYEQSSLQLDDLIVQEVPADRLPARFDLEMTLWQQGDQIDGSIIYRTELFRPQRIQRLAGHFLTLVDSILERIDLPIHSLPLLTPAEQTQLLVDWNPPGKPYPHDLTLPQLVEQHAAKNPDSIAIVCGERQWSYFELNSQANQVAQALRQQGVQRGNIVGVAIERSADWVLAILGVLKSGAAYMPLDPALPASRLQAMLEDTNTRLVLGKTELLTQMQPLLQSHQIRLLAWSDCLQHHTKTEHSVGSATGDFSAFGQQDQIGVPDDPAYVMFTSGSTGRPKGVVIPQRSIARLVFGNNYVTFGHDRVFAHLATISFDASTWEIWGALLHGSKLVIAQNEQFDFQQLDRLLKRHQVTTLFLTSTLFNELIDLHPMALAQARQVMVGGEALSVPHIVRAYQALGNHVELINGYGPTENTVFSVTYQIPRSISPDWSSVPIGKPIGGTRAYVLDEHQQPVPIGVAGELYLGGDALAIGYINQPEMTAARFVADPFSHHPTARLYRTGDRVRWRDDGQLEYLNRLDSQVKLRGFRIELGEIEAALITHPQVRLAVVVLREDRPGEKRLVGYYVPQAGQTVDHPSLVQWLQERLPAYMVPAALVALTDLPRLTSGKLDRRSLPAPAGMAPERNTKATEPRNSNERQLVKIWQELLGVERVGIQDDFFDLGGHSLLAIRLFAMIEQRLGKRLPIALLFEHSTIAQLARHLPIESMSIGRLIDLQPLGTSPPVILMPSLAGELIFAKQLIELLGTEMRVVGLQPNLSLGQVEHLRDINATAKRFAEVIRAEQPEGPYYLLGYSYGGWLAVEVARELQRAGSTVDFLGLIDTGFEEPRSASTLVHVTRRIWQAVRQLPRWYREERRCLSTWELLNSVIRKTLHRLHAKLVFRRDAEELEAVLEAQRIPHLNVDLMQTALEALRNHDPAPYDGRITLFRAAIRPLGECFSNDLGWSSRAADVEAYEVPGNHDTLLQPPHAQYLAAKLRLALLSIRSPKSCPTELNKKDQPIPSQ
jgi:amino acid adenylation domain-containing protein